MEVMNQITEAVKAGIPSLPWLAILIIYLGEKIQQLVLTRILRDALAKSQDAAHAAIPPPIRTVTTATPGGVVRTITPQPAQPQAGPQPQPVRTVPQPQPAQPASPAVPVGPAPLRTDHIALATLSAEYLQDWQALVVAPAHAAAVHNDAEKILGCKAAYEAVSAALPNRMPWWVIGIIDMMEGGGGADTNPCNGQTLKRRTTLVPPGRPPAPLQPPFTFQQAAVDAMTYMGFDKTTTWTIDVVSWTFEKQNGFGYRAHHVRSPYLYGFSNLEQPGKYIADHDFSATAVNEQAGALTILKELMALDLTIALT